MPSRPTALLAALLVAIAPAAPRAERPAPAASRRTVVVLHSISQEVAGLHELSVALTDGLQRGSPDPLDIYSEYTGLDRFSGTAYEDALLALYREKYRNRKVDLLVVVGPDALDFVTKRNFLPGVPVVTSYVARRVVEEARLRRPELTGALPAQNAPRTLELMLAMYPATRRIDVVLGASEYERRQAEVGRRIFSGFAERGGARLPDRPLARADREARGRASRRRARALREPPAGRRRARLHLQPAGRAGLGREPAPALRPHPRGHGVGHPGRGARLHGGVREGGRRPRPARPAGRGPGLHPARPRRRARPHVRLAPDGALGHHRAQPAARQPGALPDAHHLAGARADHRDRARGHRARDAARRRARAPAAAAPPRRAGARPCRDPLPHGGRLHPRLGVLAAPRRHVRVRIARLRATLRPPARRLPRPRPARAARARGRPPGLARVPGRGALGRAPGAHRVPHPHALGRRPLGPPGEQPGQPRAGARGRHPRQHRRRERAQAGRARAPEGLRGDRRAEGRARGREHLLPREDPGGGGVERAARAERSDEVPALPDPAGGALRHHGAHPGRDRDRARSSWRRPSTRSGRGGTSRS